MMQTPELVLFDLDGTLVDSVPDLAYSIDLTLRELDMPLHGEEKIRTWVGRGADKLVKAALTGEMDGEPDKTLFEKAFTLFSEIYIQNTSKRSQLYPGAREAMDHLKNRGCKLGCVTNKRERFTRAVLESFGLLDDFDIVVSGDTLSRKKPEPDQLLYAAEQTGVPVKNCLMVGDSINDLKAARSADMPILCVTYGYNHGRDIASANPDFLIDSLTELIELFPA